MEKLMLCLMERQGAQSRGIRARRMDTFITTSLYDRSGLMTKLQISRK